MKHSLPILLLAAIGCTGPFQARTQTAVLTGFGALTTITTPTYQKTGTFGGVRNVRITANKAGSAFFVANNDRSKILVVNASGTAFTDSINIPAFEVAGMQHADTLFGISVTGKALYRINTASKATDSLVVSGSLSGIKERPGTTEVWAADEGRLRVFNTAGPLSSTLVPLTGSNLDLGEIRFTATGDTAYVSMNNSRRLYRINAGTKAKIDSVGIPLFPAGLELSADGTRAFTSASLQKRIYVYQTATMALVDSIRLAKEPQALYRNPYKNEIWAVQQFQNQVYVFNPATLAAIDSVTGTASNPGHLAFGPFASSGGGTGIGLTASNRIGIYPNPTAGWLVIRASDTAPLCFTIAGPDGKLVLSGSPDASGGIDVSCLPAGAYLLKLYNKQTGSFQAETILRQ